MTLSSAIVDLKPCREACEYLDTHADWQAAWDNCPRADWMLWLLVRVATTDRNQLVRAACAIARTALKYVPEGELRPLAAIETAEKWVNGAATLDEVRTTAAASAAASAASASAASASAASASAASASAYAASYASYAASYAYAASAAYATIAAFAASAYAASAAAASAASAAAASAAARKEHAAILRTFFPQPPMSVIECTA